MIRHRRKTPKMNPSLQKAKSDISFDEYSKKISHLQDLQTDWGFYYDIEANRWQKAAALCDCERCLTKTPPPSPSQSKERHIENENNKNNYSRQVYNFVNFIFVASSFIATLTVLYHFC
jgi:hypothetical protein